MSQLALPPITQPEGLLLGLTEPPLLTIPRHTNRFHITFL